jgi:peptidoglycan/LPS O-acetylase OafA/YrhL
MGESTLRQPGTVRRAYLDTFRAIACLLVFFYHWALNLQAGKIIFFGYNGVHLFLVLSGYLKLGGKLLEKLSSGNKWQVTLGYLKHRFLRIYPAYFVCLSVFVILRYVSGTNPPEALNILSRVGLYFNYLDMSDFFAIHAFGRWPSKFSFTWSCRWSPFLSWGSSRIGNRRRLCWESPSLS